MTDAPSDAAALLAAYDAQLRREAEVPSALSTRELGPLILATYAGRRGFITYRDLTQDDGSPATADWVRHLVEQARAHYEADPGIDRVEWKTRRHDHAPGLEEALRDNGFVAEEPESVMVGEATMLAQDLPLPEGVTIHRAGHADEAARVERVAGEIFGDPPDRVEAMVDEVRARFERDPLFEVWFAEADGEIVTTGRLEPVEGTEFAGIWGGSTRPEHRGRGIYRALTAARARSAIGHGKRWINSDSTEFSRPILERSGLLRVTTTTPWEWNRASPTTEG